MRKMILVERCYQCVYSNQETRRCSHDFIEDKLGRIIPIMIKIPDWCPLEDAPKEKRKK